MQSQVKMDLERERERGLRTWHILGGVGLVAAAASVAVDGTLDAKGLGHEAGADNGRNHAHSEQR